MPANDCKESLNQRGWDLLRQMRHELFVKEGLITAEEFSLLARDHPAVARLEDYDEVRGKLTAAESALCQLRRELEASRDVQCQWDARVTKAEAQFSEAAAQSERFRQALIKSQGEARKHKQALELLEVRLGDISNRSSYECEHGNGLHLQCSECEAIAKGEVDA